LTSPAPQVPTAAPAGNADVFAFVQALAAELSNGKVELPSFPDIALRVRQVLADEEVSQEKVVRVVGSEPMLAARLLQIANSAAINFSGRAITDLRSAIARLGFNMVRSAAIAFAMSQLKKSESLKGLEQPLDDLWRSTASVAAMSYVVAKRFSRVNPDTAMLAGLLHGIGKLYILTRVTGYPRLLGDPTVYSTIVRDWHAPIAKALLENWDMAEEIVAAVSDYEDLERKHVGAPDLTDVLTVSHLLSAFKEHPETLELNMHDVAACRRLTVDTTSYLQLIEESEHEVNALREALGV
jgi:HD-like signal output (HDOD) protein